MFSLVIWIPIVGFIFYLKLQKIVGCIFYVFSHTISTNLRLYDNGWEVNEIELASYGLNKLVNFIF
jgi:hypothetical protein